MRPGLAFLTFVVVSGTALSQEPGLLPFPRTMSEVLGPDEILPAQFIQPQLTGPNPSISPVQPASAFSQAVVSPVVDIDLILPQTAAGSAVGLVPVKIVVRNRSQADAYNVVVRVPWTRMRQSTIQTPEPAPVAPIAGDGNYRWKYGTLRSGESKTITFDLKPDAALVGSGDLSIKAFVSFEHGVEATTKFGSVKLDVQKYAPKESPAGEPVSVSLQIRNMGTATLHDLKVTETIPVGCQFAEGTTGDDVSTANQPQRKWTLPALAPGETRSIGYRMIPPAGAAVAMASTAVSAKEGEQATKSSETKIVKAGISVSLRGDAEVVPGERTTYTIKVVNVGDMTQRNLSVAGSLPDNCRVTKMTNGGRVGRDRVEWMIPELKGGASYELRYAVQAERTGKHTITAVVRDERGKEYTDSRLTSFAAAADLTWESSIDPMAVAVGKIGVLTVRVKNNGGESARGVSLKVELPDVVRRTVTKPRDIKEGGREVIFPGETIPAGATRTYEVEFKGELPGRGTVSLKLDADAFGPNRPLTADKMIAVTAR
jgi:uncharacterized repeat protein (TIGR01451 family)